MPKRGQITVFIILGIIILSVLAGFWYVEKEKAAQELERNLPEVEGVRMFVESCLEKTTEKGLIFLGKQGGYYETDENNQEMFFFNLLPYVYPDNSSNLELIIIPYYFRGKDKLFPDEETLQKELAKYVEENLPLCLDNFSSFRQEGYEIILGEVQANSFFTSKKTMVEIDFPLTVKKGAIESSLSSFQMEIPFVFLGKYNLIKSVVEEQEREPGFVPLGYITNLGYENNFTFDTLSFTDAPMIQFDFKFNETLAGSFYTYTFMVDYNWTG